MPPSRPDDPIPQTAAGLQALFINTSLKRDARKSHTAKLMAMAETICSRAGADVTHIHLADYDVPNGVHADMRKHGAHTDDWPDLWNRVEAADILVIGTPIWLGQESSLCRTLVERLYAMSGTLNEKGQSIFYGMVGGTMITGNEDGLKHCASSILFALQHLGCTIPPQADCGWIGEAGPGPSFGDPQETGPAAGSDSEFTQRNTTIMTWNLIHMARLLKEADGLPRYGNDRTAWSEGARFGLEQPHAVAN
ncbi:flavodoxin family protein [Hyphomonas chukchiensis]|uniref:flavodoxin family protein n=1 Tax=Hyphomonas chukchiensis TaxID=1280947 RepID=UPI0030F88DD1